MVALNIRAPLLAALSLLTLVLGLAACSPPPPQVGAVLVGDSAVRDAGGEVEVVRAGSGEVVSARPGLELATGDVVRTGERGQAILSLEGGRVEVLVFESTEVELGSIFTKIGKVVVRVYRKVKDRFEVESEYAVAGAEGTTFLVGVGPEEDPTYECAVLAGRVELRPAKPTDQDWMAQTLTVGQVARGRRGSDVELEPLDPARYDDIVRRINVVERAFRPGAARLVAPDVVGMDEEAARRRLEADGLETVSDPELSRQAPVGTVLEQRPAAGSAVRAGSTVRLTVAAEATTVPDVSGLSRERAEARLAAARLEPGRVSEEMTGRRRPGEVVRQIPPAGTEVAMGSPVHLVLEATSVRVPDLTGSSRRQLAGLLERAELRIGSVETRPGGEPAGTVVGQKPTPGSLVPPGTRVDVIVVEAACTVPDLGDRSRDVALRILKEAGLVGEVESVRRYARDTVFGQRPEAGTEVQCGAVVYLTLGTDLG